jgi:hypothetical protein
MVTATIDPFYRRIDTCVKNLDAVFAKFFFLGQFTSTAVVQRIPSEPRCFRRDRILLHALGNPPQNIGPLIGFHHWWRNHKRPQYQQVDFRTFRQIGRQLRHKYPATVDGSRLVPHVKHTPDIGNVPFSFPPESPTYSCPNSRDREKSTALVIVVQAEKIELTKSKKVVINETRFTNLKRA